MATLFEIPIEKDPEEPSLRIRTILDQIEIVLDFDWNSRMERWIISVYDPATEPLLLGHPLNINLELIERFEIPGLPPGRLILYDTSLNEKEASLEDLGDRCKLYYFSDL